ncbi:MAG TPA: hypothetical protein VHJ18_09045 [Streptosporangiaceae bacterium]|jgi:hypothetical protein|nr:hypothetical protein [Streptosporangiaceae bacterium]
MTIASYCAFDLSPDNRYVFVAVAGSFTNVSLVASWSATTPIWSVRLPSNSDTPDSQELIVALSATSH